MSKVRDISGLANIIKTDANGNVTFVSGSTTLMAISSSGAVTSTGTIGGSNSSTLATTGSNTFTGQQYVSNTNAPVNFTDTASLYTDGGLRVGKDAYVSGTLYLNNLTVYGTQSVNFITSSQLDIADNIITVNTSTPAIRFGGIAVRDSGSLGTGLTGSLLWDSQNNHWVYTNPSGSNYSGGMLMSGPRASALGEEQGTTNNALMKGQGGDHITSSAVFEVSGSVGIGVSSPNNTLNVRGDNGTSTAAVLRLRDTNTTARTTRLQFEDYTGALADGLIDFKIGTAGNASTATLSMGINSAGLTFNNSNAATFASSVTASGLKSQFIAEGGASSGAGIALNTSLSGTDRRNWFLGTEENIAGDFVIKSSNSAGGSGQSGTTRLAILNNGNVGIGTSSPSGTGVALNVKGVSGNTVSMVISESADAGSMVSLYSGASSGDNPSLIYLKDLRFGSGNKDTTGYVERMRITSGGDVQIQGTNSSAKITLFRNYSNNQPGISVYNTSGTEVLYFNGNNSSLGISGNISANNINTLSFTLQGLGTPVSTGLGINAYSGGRTYLLLTSQQWSDGNSTSSTITMIRCGYDGNNFSVVVLGSSNATAETWSQSGGILYVTGNTNFQLDITVLSNG
jgi:hypothetical protein